MKYKYINKNQNFFHIITFIIIICINSISTFQCGFDELDLEPSPLNITFPNKKRKTQSEYQPIKIKADYTNLQIIEPVKNSTLKLIKQAIEETLSEFSKFLNVQHKNIGLKGIKEQIKAACQLDDIDNDYENYLIDNDVVIFPYFRNDLNPTTIAAAAYCLYDINTFQPYFGVLCINANIQLYKKNTKRYLKTVLLHEITHILVFHPSLLKKLRLIETIDSFSYINSTKVISKAKLHFNCENLTRLQLENQGGYGSSGAHWEARYMLGDYMISTDYMDTVISDITLALFEDSGFYQVNYYTGGLFKFGKNKGCSFFKDKCIVNGETNYKNEFCTSYLSDSCSPTRENKGQCMIYSYNDPVPQEFSYFTNPNQGGFYPCDYCPVTNINTQDSQLDYYPTNCKVGDSSLSSYGEIISDTSFCFISSLLPETINLAFKYQAICYKVSCDNINKKIIVHIGSSSVECPTFGGSITEPPGFKGVIECPKYIDVCSSEDNNICNDMFDCLNKKSKVDESSYSYNDIDWEKGEDEPKILLQDFSQYFINNLYINALLILFFI